MNNDFQYCIFVASRLGRRPKRLKDVSGEHGKSHGNLPIAPYPSPAEMYRLRMAELQKLLQANGTFKAELMEAFLSAAQASFRDHAKQPSTSENSTAPTSQQQQQQQQHQPPPQQQPPTQFASPNMPVTTVESGYSSLSSPASSKSQSPSQDPNLLLGNNSMNFMDNLGLFNVPSLDGSPSMTSPMDSVGSNQIDSNVLSPLPDGLNLDACFNEFLNMESVSIKAEPVSSPSCCQQQLGIINNDYIERALKEVKLLPSDTRRHLIEQVTDSVISAHMLTCINSHQAVEEANNKINKMLISDPEFAQHCSEPSFIWSKFLKQMVPELTNVVKFCKKLPGFLEIDQEDQIKLIKQGSFEVLLARFSMLVSPETNEMIDPTLSVRCSRAVVAEMPMGFLFDEFFNVSEQFNPLKLTDGEIGLFTSLLIICPERQNLKNKRAIKKIQGLFQQALFLMMKRNHSDTDHMFMKLLTMIPMFQKINDQHSTALNNIKMNAPDAFEKEFEPLHKEVFDTSM
ncbi:hypothetical protein SNE40_014629 [Patella caerulea]|uniref:NR LBD domain-containing protein n=1 Tax=Patella caerulea TaxID=87958 RepID=A0AAN8PTP6_PATCE